MDARTAQGPFSLFRSLLGLALLLPGEHLLVELQLLALQDVPEVDREQGGERRGVRGPVRLMMTNVNSCCTA